MSVNDSFMYGIGITVEDGIKEGGLGSAVTEWFNDRGHKIQVTRIGVPDSFVPHGKVPELMKMCGMDADAIHDSRNASQIAEVKYSVMGDSVFTHYTCAVKTQGHRQLLYGHIRMKAYRPNIRMYSARHCLNLHAATPR